MHILIADDHRLIIEGVTLKLAELAPEVQFSVAMDVAQLRQAIRDEPAPTLALIDLAIPGSDGYRHLVDTIQGLPGVPVMVLSGAESPSQIKELLALGVQGFVPKAYTSEVMLSAVRLVLSGGVYVPPMMLQQEPVEASAPAGFAPVTPVPTVAEQNATMEHRLKELLTERQLDVMRLLSQGQPNKIVARDLGISEGIVKIHLAAISRALNVRNRVEAVITSQRISAL